VIKISAKLNAGQCRLYTKISIKSITPPKYILSNAFAIAPDATNDNAIVISFLSFKIAKKATIKPTDIEKIEKKYLPNFPLSLNMPKLTPVFLTKTRSKKGNIDILEKLLENINCEINIFEH